MRVTVAEATDSRARDEFYRTRLIRRSPKPDAGQADAPGIR